MTIVAFIVSEIVRAYGSIIAYDAWQKIYIIAFSFSIIRYSYSRSISKFLSKIAVQNVKNSE